MSEATCGAGVPHIAVAHAGYNLFPPASKVRVNQGRAVDGWCALTAKPAKYLTGLIGAPIAASAAPAMHEQAAEALGVRCHYQLIEVAGADVAGLRALLEGVRRLGFAGVNVTFP